jgi:hypothetical protein
MKKVFGVVALLLFFEQGLFAGTLSIYAGRGSAKSLNLDETKRVLISALKKEYDLTGKYSDCHASVSYRNRDKTTTMGLDYLFDICKDFQIGGRVNFLSFFQEIETVEVQSKKLQDFEKFDTVAKLKTEKPETKVLRTIESHSLFGDVKFIPVMIGVCYNKKISKKICCNTKIFAGAIFAFGTEEMNFEERTLNFEIDAKVKEKTLISQEYNKKNISRYRPKNTGVADLSVEVLYNLDSKFDIGFDLGYRYSKPVKVNDIVKLDFSGAYASICLNYKI